MIMRFLNSTTALVVSASLAMPTQGLSQSETADGEAELAPCIDAAAVAWTEIPKKGKEHRKARKEMKKKDKKISFALTEQTEKCVIEDGEAQLVVTGIKTETGEVYASFKEVMAAVNDAPEDTAESAAESANATDNAAPEAQVTEETATDATADPASEDSQVAEEVTTEELTEALSETEANTQAESSADAGKDAPKAKSEKKAKKKADQAEENTAANAQAEADVSEDVSTAGAEGDVSTDKDDGMEAELLAESESSDEALNDDTQKEAAKEVEVEQEDTAESTAAANETVETQAAASVDAEAAPESVKVETKKVTKADTRKSSEDFETAVGAQVAEDDDGLSNFEKFAIGALGVVAAGTLLNNGDKVVSNSGDRVVVQRSDGEYQVLKDDNALLRQPGVEITTERFSDGSTRETVYRENGNQVVTIKAANGQVLRRVRVLKDGRQIVLFDDTETAEPVQVTELPEQDESSIALNEISSDELRMALAAQDEPTFDRRFSLQQIRQIRAVRELVPVIELEAVTFDTGSAAIRASEAEELRDLGNTMSRMIEENPYEVFLVEGHTDAVGNATYNLALSDRRAESVALALTEYFDVPPENMVVQGYGESNLKIRTPLGERANRRATVRRITTLLKTASLD